MATTTEGLATREGYERRAAFYDVEYAETADQPFLRRLLTPGTASVLEVPCGAGRNLDWLAASGRSVVCADVEPAMVDRVRSRIAELGAGDRVSAEVADLRTFDLGRTFDLVLVPQEAFQLLDGPGDGALALGRLARHLAPGGTLLLDLHTFGPDTAGGTSPLPDYFDPAFADDDVIDEWTRPMPQGRWLHRSRTQHGADDLMRIVYRYRMGGADGAVEEWESAIAMRRYDRGDVDALAHGADLRVELVLADYDATRWTPGAARMVTLLRRVGAEALA